MDVIKLIDVGARDGIDSRWAPFFSALEVTAFEADIDECDRLNRKSWPYKVEYLPVALGANDGEEVTLKICRSPGCSSTLWPNHDLVDDFEYGAAMEVVREVPVVLSRMESVMKSQPDVIKVDTQGTEIDVVDGAGALLDQTIAVELEVEFVRQYKGQRVFADVDAHMRSAGFFLRGLRRTYWRNSMSGHHPYGGQLIHGDALYLRHEMLDSPKGHIILAAYRQFDLLAKFGAAHLIPREGLLLRALGRLVAGIPNRELRRFVDRIRPPGGSDWHDPDFF